jgi:peptide/nickel transport system permease protein
MAMRPYLVRRLLLTLPVVLGVVTLVFLLIHLIPGDPVDIMLGEAALPADRDALREALGLDRPMLEQFGSFLWGLCRGDLGVSLQQRRPVSTLIREHYPATLQLTLAAMLISLLIALPAGVVSGIRQYSFWDHSTMFMALLGVSMPNFWLGPLLIWIFSIQLGWFPVSGKGGLSHLLLPALTLGASMAAIVARMTRSSVLEVLRQDYVMTARAKGLSEARIILKHVLRNAMLPVLTVVGLQFGALLTGSIITETIFSWPGLGTLMVKAIQTRDYPLVQGCVLVIALSYVLVNLLTDLLYGVIDPRIRYEGIRE